MEYAIYVQPTSSAWTSYGAFHGYARSNLKNPANTNTHPNPPSDSPYTLTTVKFHWWATFNHTISAYDSTTNQKSMFVTAFIPRNLFQSQLRMRKAWKYVWQGWLQHRGFSAASSCRAGT